VADVYKKIKINVYDGEKLIYSKTKSKAAPGEMEKVLLKKETFENAKELTFKLEEI
jgi:hypothetical protein